MSGQTHDLPDGDARLAAANAGQGAALPELPELPGYRIIRQLARGGMGAVYLAQRTSSEFDHKVAIKIIPQGTLSDSVISRFRRERQLLAQLSHTNIAHLYEGGETHDGTPYLVMEYVHGCTLGEWLESGHRSLDERLAMFLQVARAVEFAHQNQIIHRDLTPRNVLVTDDGQAKLIDFGIARPQAVAATGLEAQEGAQVVGASTLTDVYSLGHILALMTASDAEAELSAITARASAGQVGGRFGSVGELIAEIGNFRSKLPVISYSDTACYRVCKFIAREPGWASAAAAILLALIAAMVVAGLSYSRADSARGTAQLQLASLRDLAHFQLFDLYDQLDHVAGTSPARAAIAGRAQQYLRQIADRSANDAALQLDTGEGLLRLARIQGVPAYPNLGQSQQATENLDRAQAILEPLAVQGVPRAQIAMALLEAYRTQILGHGESDVQAALLADRRAEEWLGKVPLPQHDRAWMQARRESRYAALEAADLARDPQALTRYSELLESDHDGWPADQRGNIDELLDQARTSYYRARSDIITDTTDSKRRALTRLAQADSAFAAAEAASPDDPVALYWRAWNGYFGFAVAAALDDYSQGDVLLREARQAVEQLQKLEENDNGIGNLDERLNVAEAQSLSSRGQSAQAVTLMRDVIAARRARVRTESRVRAVSDLAVALAIMGDVQRQSGRQGTACSNWREADQLMNGLEARNLLAGYIAQMHRGISADLAGCPDR